MTPLSDADASAIWAVLVEHAGAVDGTFNGEAFVQFQSTKVCDEYRFVGSLGLGGKFRRNRVWIGEDLRETWTVDCYPEDVTPARATAIEATNEALAELTKEKTR